MISRLQSRPGRTTATLVLTAMLALASCKETAGPDGGGTFTITPNGAEIVVGNSVQLTANGAPSKPSWSSSDSRVASVIQETGFVTGVSAGTATISAVAGSAVASINVTVVRPPAIAIAQPTVDFFMDVGGANPASQTVQVTNGGDRPLTGVNVQGITYGPNNPQPWLSVTPSGDTAPLTLTLVANGQGLARGTYSATVQIAAPGVENSPQSLAIMLHVQAPAEFAVSRASVPMAGIPDVTINETVDVTNAGDKTLDGLAVEVRYPPGQPGAWLNASLDATTAPTTLRLTGSTQNLPVGSYTTIVHLSSSVAGVAPVDITVDLTVSPGPAIALSSTVANFQANTGQNPANQSIDVSNAGGGTLSDLSLGTITYGSGQPTGWLTATLSGTTAPASIGLAVASAALPQGSYSATLSVQSTVASNSPVNLTVNLNVGPPPIINLNPGNILFLGWVDASNPLLQGIQVTNAAVGMGPLPGLSYSIQYGVGASGWLHAAWQDGNTSAPTTLLLNPNTTALPAGAYTATITISTSVPGVAPVIASVTYRVQSYTLDIYPLWSSQGCTGCHSGGFPSPDFTQSVQNTYNTLLGTYVTPFNTSTSSGLPCILFGACFHTGGKFPQLQGIINGWINGGALLR